jgi:hypothetical protein
VTPNAIDIIDRAIPGAVNPNPRPPMWPDGLQPVPDTDPLADEIDDALVDEEAPDGASTASAVGRPPDGDADEYVKRDHQPDDDRTLADIAEAIGDATGRDFPGAPGRSGTRTRDIVQAIITKHVYRISVEPRLIDPFYLMNALRGAEAVLAQMGANIRGQTRPGINGEILKSLFIPVAPLAEQREVVARINSGVAAIAAIESERIRALGLLSRLEQSILSRAFRGEIVAQDPADEPAETLLARFQSAKSSPQRRGRRPSAA